MKSSFNPLEIEFLAKVVNEACQKLGVVDSAAKENIAARVLDYAAEGERDFDTLLSFALAGKVVTDGN